MTNVGDSSVVHLGSAQNGADFQNRTQIGDRGVVVDVSNLSAFDTGSNPSGVRRGSGVHAVVQARLDGVNLAVPFERVKLRLRSPNSPRRWGLGPVCGV